MQCKFHSCFRVFFIFAFRWLALASWMALSTLPSLAQSAPASGLGWDGHLVWVQPFENNSAQPGLDWIGSSFPDIMNQRLTSAGFLTIHREDRRYALKHLGLPSDFHPTQATTYRIAQTLDADYVIFGNYTVASGQITATARVLEMYGPRMEAMLEVKGNLDQLISLENELAWKVAMQIEPSLHLDEQTFLAASQGLRLDAFENYIRGEVEPGIEERISHLTKAVQLSPNYTQAWLELGKAYFANQQYEQAVVPLSKVPMGSRYALEAQFYAGLSYLYTGNYAKAQMEFSSIASVLPMPEVLNNEGIAINRRGQNGTALFQRVVQLNPQNPDYWFNLAVSERRTKNYTAALKSISQSLVLRPQDEEAQGLRKNLIMLKDGPIAVAAEPVSATQKNVSTVKAPAASTPSIDKSSIDKPETNTPASGASSSATAGASATSPDYEPLERIARSYDESAFRQAAFAMEQMNAMKLHSMAPDARATLLCQQGNAYVNDGLLLEAQREFQLALASDPQSAAAFAGLAQIHEYVGSPTMAQREANQSINIQPNVAAYLVLARLALAQHSLPIAQQNVEHALQIDPKNSAARGIQQAIQSQLGK